MLIFWVCNSVVWAILLLYVISDAWESAFAPKTAITRQYGPMFTGIAGVSVMMGGFSIRWILFPDNLFLWQVLYFLSAVLALFLGCVAHEMRK